VVVVGGGPVGLAAAMYAVGSGLSVVVLEPRQGAIDKACGEGLMPGGVRGLTSAVGGAEASVAQSSTRHCYRPQQPLA
jgi:flavin-dependent dehydrogenase